MPTRLFRRFALLGLLLLSAFGVGRAVAAPASPTTTAAGNDGWQGDVCYEIFVRSFADSNGDGIGDFNGLTARLDYLNDGNPATTSDLGVTCVWLMPIFQATSYHGYDVEDPEKVEPDYGTLADFTAFLKAAHQRGIRVLLDLVLNHTSINSPWFQSAVHDPNSPYRDWYIFSQDDPGYPGPFGEDVWFETGQGDYYYAIFGSGMPDLNYRNPVVTAEADKVAAYWLDLGVDGYRLDAIKHLIEEGKKQQDTDSTHEWLRGFRTWMDAHYPTALTVGEIFDASATTLQPYYPDQLDRYFQFDIASQLLGAPPQGVGSGIDYVVSDALSKQPGQPWATFLTNHDQPRTMSVLNGDIVQAKLAAIALLTIPGLPFIYYGEEIGMTGAKPDERIRTPMQWDATSGHGFTIGSPWETFQDDASSVNVADEANDPASLLSTYRDLIHLRTSRPAISHGNYELLETTNRAVYAFVRYTDDQADIVIINFGSEPTADLTLTGNAVFPTGRVGVGTEYGGVLPSSISVVSANNRFTLTLSAPIAPQSAAIFSIDSPN